MPRYISDNDNDEEHYVQDNTSKRQIKQEKKNIYILNSLIESYRKNDDRFRLIDADHIIKWIHIKEDPDSYYESNDDDCIENFIDDVCSIYKEINRKVLLNIIVKRIRKFYVY
jgi:hypothetical protein